MSSAASPNTAATTAPATAPSPPPPSQPIAIPGRSQSHPAQPVALPDNRTSVPPARLVFGSGAGCSGCDGINEHTSDCKINAQG